MKQLQGSPIPHKFYLKRTRVSCASYKHRDATCDLVAPLRSRHATQDICQATVESTTKNASANTDRNARKERVCKRRCFTGDPVHRLHRFTGLEEAYNQVLEAGTSPAHAEHPVAILWDLDNLPATSIGNGVLMAIRLKAAVQELTGPVTSFLAYGNDKTLAHKREHLGQALALLGIKTFRVTTRRNSADLVLRSAMYAFAAQNLHKGRSCVAILSSDNGFASSAKYCRAKSIRVLVVGSHRQRDPMRPLLWTNAALAQAANVALRWNPTDLIAASAAEVEQLHALRASGASDMDFIDDVISQASAAKAGYVGETWVNARSSRIESESENASQASPF